MIRLIVDSSCDLKQSEIKEDFVTVLPMTITFDNEDYYDGVTINNQEFYQKLSQAKELPRTSQVNTSTFLEQYKLAQKNKEDVLVLTISSELSGTINSARIAKEELGMQNIELVDSRLVTFAYKALVNEAIKLIKEGKSLIELRDELLALREKVILLAVIGDLKYLIMGGRLSRAKGFVANALSIKPILTMVDGKLDICKKVVGVQKGYIAIADLISKNYDVDYSRPQYVGHSANENMALDLQKVLLEKTKIRPQEICELGPTVGTHAGPGCTGVAFFIK